MKKLFAVSCYLGSFWAVSIGHAADLKRSKFTQVVNDVRVISMANNRERPAAVNDIFNMPDLVRTGEASRAELVAADDTITRVGANTVFSFDPASRTIDLQQGSLLFHSPKGKGGGTIRTGSATASVLGTTIIVTTTHNGGFKVIDLEGHVAIRFLNGLRQNLNPGQMTFVLPGGHPAPVINIRLDKLTHNSKLVQGFAVPLPSMPLIQQQIADQIKLIQSGQAQDTGLLVGDVATTTTVQVVDANTIKNQDNESTTSGGDTTGGGTPPPAPPAPPTPPAAGTINSSTLPTAYIVSSPFTAGSLTFPFGFSAPNITIGTPTIDLSPYSNVAEFAFVAPNGILTIKGSVVFTGLSATAILDLYANQFTIASGSTVEADVGSFNLYPQTATTLNGVAIVDNAVGVLPAVSTIQADDSFSSTTGINIISPAAFSLTNGSSISAPNSFVSLDVGSVTLNNSTVQGGSVDIFGATGVSTASNSNLTATGGDLFIFTGTGDVDLSATTIKAIAPIVPDESLDGSILIDGIGGMANLTNGTAITAAGTLIVAGDNGVTIADSTLTAGNGTFISSGGTLSVTGSPTTTGYATTFTGNTDIIAATSLNVNGAIFNADQSSGTVALSTLSGSMTLKDALFTTGTLELDSNILSDSGSITLDGASITAGTLSLTSGINTGSINIQNSAINSFTPLTLTSGATSGTVTINNSFAQASSMDFFGATGINITGGASLTATGGNLDADGGGIDISASSLSAIAGPDIGDSASGDVDIEATGGAVNISNGTLITAANQLSLSSDTGISISGASRLTSSGGVFIEGDPSGTSAPVSVMGNSTLTSGTESNLVIQAGTALTVNGATLNADPIYGEVFMSSDTDSITVQNASITAGAVSMHDFGTSGSITVQNTSITTPMVTMIAGSASGSITVQDSTINAPTVTMTANSTATTDSVTIGNTSITTSTLTLNSGDGILLDGAGGLNGGGSGTATLTAPANSTNPNCTLTVSNADFSTYSTVNMAGYTVYLTNVMFSGTSTVNITSREGVPNFSPTPATTVPGDVNFIGNNNKYGATPINAGTLNSSTLPNIHLGSTT